MEKELFNIEKHQHNENKNGINYDLYTLLKKDNCNIYVNKNNKIALPESLLPETLQWYHVCLGHLGINRTYNSIAMHFYCKHLLQKVNDFVKKCTGCIQGKRNVPKYGKLPPALNTIYQPWETIQVDLFGPWKFVDANNKERKIHAISIIDPATRWIELHMLKQRHGKTDLNVALILENEWFCRYPRPTYCIFDNGTEFGFEILDLLLSYGITPKPTSIKNPQANAIVERVHQTIADSIRAQGLENKQVSHEQLHYILQSTAFGL
jgi:hypothetical protein